LEKAELLEAIWEYHKSNSILNTCEPEPSIDVSVNPMHLTISLAKVFLVISFIDISTLPIELSIAVFLVSAVLALKLIAYSLSLAGIIYWVRVRLLPPLSFAMFHSVKKLSSICITVSPFILTEAVGIAIAILPNVLIIVGKEV
jgi:hypothetical protein